MRRLTDYERCCLDRSVCGCPLIGCPDVLKAERYPEAADGCGGAPI